MSPRKRLFASTSTVLRSGCGWLASAVLAIRLAEKPASTARAAGRARLRHVLGVARDELHLVVHAPEFDDLRAAETGPVRGHRAAVEACLADPARDLRRQEEGPSRSRSGLSSSQNFSSFCHTGNSPVATCFASFVTVANGCGWPGRRRRVPVPGAAGAEPAGPGGRAAAADVSGGLAPVGGMTTAHPERASASSAGKSLEPKDIAVPLIGRLEQMEAELSMRRA